MGFPGQTSIPKCCLGALQQLSGVCAGSGTDGRICSCRAFLPSRPGHPTEPVRAWGRSETRVLMPQLWCHTMGSSGTHCPHLPSHELLPHHQYPAVPLTSALSGGKDTLVTSLTPGVNPTPAPTLKLQAHPALTVCSISPVLQASFSLISPIILVQGIPASRRILTQSPWRLAFYWSPIPPLLPQETSMMLSCSCSVPRQDYTAPTAHQGTCPSPWCLGRPQAACLL